MTEGQFGNLADFIAGVRAVVLEQHPHAQAYFDIYANEAKFGLSVIEKDINRLPREAEILEVGAGLLLLSGFLASQGFRVHALEPIAPGFSHFKSLQSAIAAYYEKLRLQISLIDSTIEDFPPVERFEYAFSINVFEHIQNVERGLYNAYMSLKNHGGLRIYCPNYHFPYEPHFNIPTLINKRLTGFFLKSTIMKSSHLPEAKATWDGLNWITVTQVRRICATRLHTTPLFNRLAAYQIMQRMLSDPQFRKRRSRWVMLLLNTMAQVGVMRLFKWMPIRLSPVFDVYIERANSPDCGHVTSLLTNAGTR